MFRLYEVDPDADVLLILPAASAAAAAPNGRESGASNPPASPPPELRIKVSSKHLGLASRHFRDRLKWGEWSSSEPDGRFHVRLEGFDAGAVAIVMDVLHGRGGRVPRSVDLETLAKVAVFVDEFQCFDAVEVYAERWIGKLEGSLPGAFGRDAVLWMFVAYVFRRSDLFKEVTRLAILHSTGPISGLGLPVREKIISKELLAIGLDCALADCPYRDYRRPEAGTYCKGSRDSPPRPGQTERRPSLVPLRVRLLPSGRPHQGAASERPGLPPAV